MGRSGSPPMKTILALLSLFTALQAFAEDHPSLAAVQAADKARVAAMQSGDRAKLDGIFSDELRYAHSNGIVDTKKSFIEILGAGKTKYVGYDYEEQNFTFPAPGIALMTGRAHVKAESEGKTMDAVLSFLAVWREEKGQWRFLAWQSCKLPPVVK
jgi:ketosteroid isomerase-like protein